MSEMSRNETTEESSGQPLPFEMPYWDGVHNQSDGDEEVDDAEVDDAQEDDAQEDGPLPLPFYTLELGEAAFAWLFGMSGEGAPDDEVQHSLSEVKGCWDVPMHAFLPSARGARAKKGWRRFFGGS